MPSEIRSIGPTIRRLAKGTIDLVRWRAPVQLLKYATRTVWFKNVNTGYPIGSDKSAGRGGAEKAHSRQRRWCLCSVVETPVNLGKWGLVPDPIAMARAFAELGYGTVVQTLAKTVSDRNGHISAQTL